MSTMTAQAPTRPRKKVSQARVIRSEWIKFWSLRSSVITTLVGMLLLIGPGLIASASFSGDMEMGEGGGPGGDIFDPITASLAGADFAMLAFGTLGVLLMAGEYSTGMIRSSLAAVPKRLPVLWAKIAVFTGVVFTLALAAAAIAFTAGQAVIGDDGASWSDAGVARAVVGTAVVITGSGLIGIALGALLRSTPGAITTLFGLMFLLAPIAGLLLPDDWSDVQQYLPSSAASAFTATTQGANALEPWQGLAVFGAYVITAVATAAWRLKRSDA